MYISLSAALYTMIHGLCDLWIMLNIMTTKKGNLSSLGLHLQQGDM